MKPFPERRCSASRICRDPGVIVAGSRLTPCLKHLQKQAKKPEGSARLKRTVRVEGEKRAFGSGWEAESGMARRAQERAGEIEELEFQVSFALRIKDGVCVVDPKDRRAKYYPPHVPRVSGACVTERYVADCVFKERGKWIVADDKAGYISEKYRRKRKWMWDAYGIRIRENHKPRKNLVLKGRSKT